MVQNEENGKHSWPSHVMCIHIKGIDSTFHFMYSLRIIAETRNIMFLNLSNVTRFLLNSTLHPQINVVLPAWLVESILKIIDAT